MNFMESHPKSRLARPASVHTFLLVALAVLGAVLILLRNHPYGPAIVGDSVTYIGTAESLLAGEGWTEPNGIPYTTFGPLYPALLALPGLFSAFEPRAVAGPLNALLFGLTVFTAGHWLRQRIASRWLALWGLLALVFSPLTRMFEYAMSEPLFILLMTAALFTIDRFLREGRRAALIWAGVFLVLASLARSAGGLLAISLGILLLLQPGARPLERMKRCAAFILIFVISISLRMLHNILVGGPVSGLLGPPRLTMTQFLEALLSALGSWIAPGLPAEAAIALGAVMLAALAIAVGFALVRRRPWHTFYLCGGFALGYFILMAILAQIIYMSIPVTVGGNIYGVHTRYWTPMYIPLLIALISLLDRWLIWQRPRSALRFTPRETLLALLLLIWLGSALELNRQHLIRASEGQGKHYASPRKVNDETLRFIRETPAPGKIYLNAHIFARPRFFHYHTRRPIGDLYYLPQDLEQLRQMVETAAAGELLVWFHSPNTPPPHSYDLSDLDALPALQRAASLSSGVVFRVRG